MTEIIALIAGWMVSWTGIAFLFVFCAYAMHESFDKLAAFFGILLAHAAYNLLGFNPTIIDIAGLGVVYLGIGVAWSIYRYRQLVFKLASYITPSTSSYTRKTVMDDMSFTQNLGSIVTWILIWPVSVVENVFSDLITLVRSLVTGFFKNCYLKMYNDAVKSVVPAEQFDPNAK